MKNPHRPRWASRFALCAAALCAAVTAVHAQTITAYGTGFDGTDIVNGVSTAATYNSPAATPTDPLDGQNGWTTNDTAATGTSTQLVGQSDYVGADGFFSGQTGALGGIYRTTSPTAAAPDVVPSTASGGVIGLYHAVTVPATATFVALNVDFAVTTPTSFTNQDTFGFSLRTTAGAPIVSFTFSPGTASPTTTDDVGLTIGTTAQTPTSHITLNGTYHLAFNVNTQTNAFTASVVSTSGGTPLTFAATLTSSALSIAQVAATWNLGDKTTLNSTSNGYQNADDNALIFDNLAATVPEPSTYALLALGLIGMTAAWRLRGRQA